MDKFQSDSHLADGQSPQINLCALGRYWLNLYEISTKHHEEGRHQQVGRGYNRNFMYQMIYIFTWYVLLAVVLRSRIRSKRCRFRFEPQQYHLFVFFSWCLQRVDVDHLWGERFSCRRRSSSRWSGEIVKVQKGLLVREIAKFQKGLISMCNLTVLASVVCAMSTVLDWTAKLQKGVVRRYNSSARWCRPPWSELHNIKKVRSVCIIRSYRIWSSATCRPSLRWSVWIAKVQKGLVCR